MKNLPLVSVIILTYNRYKLLKEAMESVLHQTYKNFEIIICDDGSTDYTEDLVKECVRKHPQKIKYCRYPHTGSLSVGRNKGIKISSGKYCMFLDDDDLFTKNSIKEHVKYMERNIDIGYVFSDTKQISIDKTRIMQSLEEKHNPKLEAMLSNFILHVIINALKRYWPFKTVTRKWNRKAYSSGAKTIKYLRKKGFSKTALAEAWKKGDFIIGAIGSVMFRKSALDDLGGFDENLSVHEDFEIYTRIATKFKIGYINKVLYIRRRIHGSAMKREGAEFSLKIIRENIAKI